MNTRELTIFKYTAAIERIRGCQHGADDKAQLHHVDFFSSGWQDDTTWFKIRK